MIVDDPASGLSASARALRIEGLGPRTARILVNRLGIQTILDLYLWNWESTVACLPEFTENSAHALCQSIRAAVGTVYDYEVADALNVHGWTGAMYRAVFTTCPCETAIRYPSVIQSDDIDWIQILELEIFSRKNPVYIGTLFHLLKPWRTPMTTTNPNVEEYLLQKELEAARKRLEDMKKKNAKK
jgi:hypothetical protein